MRFIPRRAKANSIALIETYALFQDSSIDCLSRHAQSICRNRLQSEIEGVDIWFSSTARRAGSW
jgi:hypothetical protein